MALIKCKECGNEISKKAKECPSCGAPLKRGNIGCGGAILIIIILFIIIGIFSSGEKGKTPETIIKKPTPVTEKKPKLTEEQKRYLEKYVQENIDSEFIRKLDAEYHEVFVNPTIWNVVEYDIKKHFTTNMALYCSYKSSLTGEWVEIKDAYSGKTIGKVGAFGFKVYE